MRIRDPLQQCRKACAVLFTYALSKLKFLYKKGGPRRNKAWGKKTMVIKIIPDARNEEKIADIKHALETLEDDALEEYLDEFDAMYYATGERGDSILASWEEYLLERLMTDEKFYFAADIGDYDF